MSFETETQHPPRKPPASLFSPLLHQLQTSNPIEFSLPEDIRNFFKDGTSLFPSPQSESE